MLKIALPILLVTFSINAMASAPVLVSDGADVPADQAVITNDTIQQATLNAQIATDTVNMNDTLDAINDLGQDDTNVDSQTANYNVGSSSSSKDTSSDADTQDTTIYVDTSSKSTADDSSSKDTPKTNTDKTNNEESTVTIKVKPQPNPNAVTFTATENSLEKNINSWAKKYGYQVIWDVTNTDNDDPADYQWIGNETIHGTTDTEVLKQLVDGYPVNTNVWSQNNVICIDNNNLCSKEAAK